MVKEIIHDRFFLSQKSVEADVNDINTAVDLLDTLKHHQDKCVGMAANMIGVNKRIIVFDDGGKYFMMYNPEIISKSDKYITEEGCLCHCEVNSVVRYNKIKVRYQNEKFESRVKNFKGFTAQIIQHEIDHCCGVVI
ncbi:MAG: peptide deformylase [Erysipelotrichia bacterium]|nr:peptide deformylase [Erysipelotrichia bacterium]